MNLIEIKKRLDALSKSGKLEYREKAPLCDYSSFRIGGSADFIVHPKTETAMIELIELFKTAEYPFLVFGNASNVLFDDAGYRGAAIFTTEMQGYSVDGTTLTVASGMSFTLLSAKARDHGLSGLEFAYGIPGTVGGAIYMNAGAYGGSVSDHLISSVAYDPVKREVLTLEGVQSHHFGYRHSCYMENGYIILSGTFLLEEGDKDVIGAKMKDLMDSRRTKQPLEYPSAGSVFKRPEGYFAGKLIEDAGLKGYAIGAAQVSEKHAGFIINRGGATASDVCALIEHIQNTIFTKFGVMLETEIIRLGQGE